jgi:hypothetical protein
VISPTMLDHALAGGSVGFEVFPLNGKVPAIAGGRGCLDATTDPDTIRKLWAPRPHANIGIRIPIGQVVVDIDPRHSGDEGLRLLEVVHGPLPFTRTVLSGRGDGGQHLYFLAPDGPLTSRQLPAGIDLKTRGGYVVAPPSLHPDTGRPYVWADVRQPVPLPEWFADLIVRRQLPAPTYTTADSAIWTTFGQGSIADEFSATARWADILRPHGWTLVGRYDGDEDGSCWRHPTATSAWSATIKHGCLFVYSPNTPFEVTESSDPHGCTKFRAYAVLEHSGDLSAAARALRAEAIR